MIRSNGSGSPPGAAWGFTTRIVSAFSSPAAGGRVINNCLAVCEDLDGNLWFGGLNGLFRYNGRELEKEKPIAGLEKKSISAIAQDQEGRFLFGYWQSGPSDERAGRKLCRLTIAYDLDGQLQTIFVQDEKEDPLSRIGAVITGRNKVKGDEGAAARLGLPSSTLYSRMKKLGIKRARRSAG